MRLPLSLTCLSAIALGVLASSAQAQIISQTFDGYTVGAAVPVGGTNTFTTNSSNAVLVQNTNASTYFNSVSSASSVAGGDSNTNYAVFGSVASSRLRTTANATLPTGLFTAIYDINQPSTGVGGTLITILNNGAADANGGSGSLTGFTLSVNGTITAGGTGVTLGGGTSTTISLDTEVVLSLVVNPTAAAVAYSNRGFSTSLPAYNADLYATGAGGTVFYVGRLTTVTSTPTTTANQLGFANFGGTTPNLRINEVDAYSGANIAVLVPEPSTYACMLVGLLGFAFYVRSRRARCGA